MCVRCRQDDFEGQYFHELNGVLCFNCMDDLGYSSDLFKSFLFRDKIGEMIYKNHPIYEQGKFHGAFQALKVQLFSSLEYDMKSRS